MGTGVIIVGFIVGVLVGSEVGNVCVGIEVGIAVGRTLGGSESPGGNGVIVGSGEGDIAGASVSAAIKKSHKANPQSKRKSAVHRAMFATLKNHSPSGFCRALTFDAQRKCALNRF